MKPLPNGSSSSNGSAPETARVAAFPMRFLTAALALTMGVLLGMGWSAFDSYRSFVAVQGHNLRLAELRGTIVHLDEVLTMSARMAATTGDLQWERRYRQFEGVLDEAVKETLRLTSASASAEAARQTDEANGRLVALENQAFTLVREGHAAEAKTVLFSEGYEAQKKIYAAGMATLLEDVKARFAVSRREMGRRAAFFGAVALLSLGLLAYVWLKVLGRLQQWRAALAGAVAAAQGAREDQERRVEARTLELLQVQDEAAREHARLKFMFDSVPIGITWMVKGRLETRIVNPAHARITGVSADQCRELSRYRCASHPDDLVVQDALQARVESGEIDRYTLVKRYVQPDGAVHWVEYTLRYFRDALHKEVQEVSTVIDITERKRAEQALRDSEEHFRFLHDLTEATRALADPGQIMVVMARMLGEHLGASRCAYADVEKDGERFTILHDYTDGCASTVGEYGLSLFGARAVATLHRGETLVIRDVKAELRPDEGAGMFNAIGIQAIITCPLVKDGGLRAMMAVHQTAPRDWKPGEVALVLEVVERCWATIERRAAQARLAEAGGLLDAMLETSPDLIYFKDRESRFVRFSKACYIGFGLTDPEMLRGKTDGHFYTAGPALPTLADEREIIRTGRPIINQLEKVEYADGRCTWLLTTKMPWRDGEGAIVGTWGISRDVASLKDAEQKLEQAHRQLLETSRQAVIAEFATGILHNVGNVLNSVNVASSCVAQSLRGSSVANLAKVVGLLREHERDLGGFFANNPKGKQVPVYLAHLADHLAAEQAGALKELAELQKGIEHIRDIVTMQQGLAKTSGAAKVVDLNELAEDALRMNFSGVARADLEVVREFQALPTVTVEKNKVLQILVNLVRNAKQSCEASGRREKTITLRTSADNGRVRIAVVDNGLGIAPENLAKIFAHGFTTKADGHGFGLHSAVLAAKDMGGSLTVHSAGAGLGATFTLELPCDGATAPVSAPGAPASGAASSVL